jgi:hypothetical protein
VGTIIHRQRLTHFGAAAGCDLLLFQAGMLLRRLPMTSSTSQPSRSGMAQSMAKSLRMMESHST